jgi:predicted nucleic acid-binding protein
LRQIKAELATLGGAIPDNDLWIAAIARQHSLPLATRDTHFARISKRALQEREQGGRQPDSAARARI